MQSKQQIRVIAFQAIPPARIEIHVWQLPLARRQLPTDRVWAFVAPAIYQQDRIAVTHLTVRRKEKK